MAKNIVAKMKKLGAFALMTVEEQAVAKQKEKEEAKAGSSEDEEELLKEYYAQAKKKGSWRPKQGSEGWTMSGTTYLLAGESRITTERGAK